MWNMALGTEYPLVNKIGKLPAFLELGRVAGYQQCKIPHSYFDSTIPGTSFKCTQISEPP
jgi:hypothetical protein